MHHITSVTSRSVKCIGSNKTYDINGNTICTSHYLREDYTIRFIGKFGNEIATYVSVKKSNTSPIRLNNFHGPGWREIEDILNEHTTLLLNLREINILPLDTVLDIFKLVVFRDLKI